MKYSLLWIIILSGILLINLSCDDNSKIEFEEVNLNDYTNDISGIIDLIKWYNSHYDIPSTSFGIITKDTIIQSSLGVKERNTRINSSTNSLYQIASLSKMFTGIISKSLHQDSIINIHESIIKYMPHDINLELKEKLKTINIQHLIHHTSGLPQRVNQLERFPDLWHVVNGYKREKLYDDLQNAELTTSPGEKWSYSNVGYALLCHILENASNLSYDQLLKKYVSGKFNLNNTTTILSIGDIEKLAHPYVPEDNKKKTKPSEFDLHVAASGVYTNISDLIELMRLQITVYNMNDSLRKNHPLFLNHSNANIWENVHYGFGLGEVRQSKEEGLPTNYNHSGDFDGYASHYNFYPESNLGYTILTSSGGPWFDMQKNIEKKLNEIYKIR